MDLASMFAVAAGSSVLTALVTVIVNGIFGRAKAREDTRKTRVETSQYFDDLAGKWTARFEASNEKLVGRVGELEGVIVTLVDLLSGQAIPLLEQLAGTDHDVVVELRRGEMLARRAI